MPAIAMTDHGNLHGAYDFYTPARKAHGVKPIIGIEAYLTPGTHAQRAQAGPLGQGNAPRRAATTSPAAAPTPT